MEYNIISEYVGFVRDKFLDFFKFILRHRYKKNICGIFVDKYISVRYFNETNYITVKDFVNRVNKELVDLTEKVADDDNLDDIKNIVALFGYLMYFDDIGVVSEEMELINTLVSDDIIKIDNREGLKAFIKQWYLELKEGKERFEKAVHTKTFTLMEERLYRKLHYLELEHSVRISNLYSEYAIDKAYNTGTVAEDKLFITYILASNLVLNNAINLDFSRFYLVPFASSLFDKTKKCARLLNTLDNQLAKKYISIRITYSDYRSHKDQIDDLISKGYTFGLELDSKYSGTVSELLLFPYILVYDETPEYDAIMRDKDKLKSKIIRL